MPSILPSFTYDIFVSYRHNDNRSGWVTEFVKALQEELAATIKVPLSVYFDTNPHDGLLETHHVEDSLKEKLKCLIFIPIISQTYCDPNSFAWSNEFLPFLKMAGADTVGLRVRLHNGNIASRMLPIRIHELDHHDKKIIETEIGPLRAIDFTYQSAGVNRPLRPKDDEALKSGAQNVYRDQINKTANAIKEIINGMQGVDQPGSTPEATGTKTIPFVEARQKIRRSIKFPKLKTLFVSSIAVIIVLIMALIYIVTSKPIDKERLGTIRTSINLPDSVHVSFTAGPLSTGRRAMDISPDGKTIAFVSIDRTGTSYLYLRPVGGETISKLSGTGDASSPFFSPDSKWIAFFAHDKLMKISVDQGVIQTLTQTANLVDGVWGEDDRITWIGNEGNSLNTMDSQGKESKVMAAGRVVARPIQLSPDLFIVTNAYNEMHVLSLTTGMGKFLFAGCGQALINNELLFIKGNDLFSIRFDKDQLMTQGNPRLIEKGISVDAYYNGQCAISQNGTLIFANGTHLFMGQLTWQTRDRKISTLPFGTRLYGTFSLSPDNRNVAAITRGEQSELWNYNLEDSSQIRLSSKGFNNATVWSPQSSWVYYSYFQDGNLNIARRQADGRNDPELVLSNDTVRLLVGVSREETILYSKSEAGGGFTDIGLFSTKGVADGYSFQSRKSVSEGLANFIGDGWIAFTADQTGRSEVFISDLKKPSVRIQVSFEGGEEPRYDSANQKLYYRNNNKLMSTSLVFGENRTAKIGASTMVLEDQNWVNVPGYSYDISADGKKFLMVRSNRKRETTEIGVLQNFLN